MSQTIFEKSEEGQFAYSLPKSCKEFDSIQLPNLLLRQVDLRLPEVSELTIVRHFSNLAKKNVGVDNVFYPLGSCTMKYNPKINDKVAQLNEFSSIHPLTDAKFCQGSLKVIYDLQEILKQITGMHGATLLPNGGAQGEFVGLRMIRDYHLSINEGHRLEVIVPDSAHGTNPASATLAGYKVIELKSNSDGNISIEDLKKVLGSNTAALMLTNPSTLGLFIPNILEIQELVHDAGAMLYYDGANFNPLVNVVKPYDMGFDVMHINLHKTFSTPHGGGGPGSAPVLCCEKLSPFLPLPWVQKEGEFYNPIHESSQSIGYISSFYGNFSVYLRALLYIVLHGNYGLRKNSEMATLNANYLKKKLEKYFTVPFKKPCMHEFVLQADKIEGVRALDIAKRLLDFGVHAPTIYFPIVIKECLLVEPTETESLKTLDRFHEIIAFIFKELQLDPSEIKNAPYTLDVSRLDEKLAVKKPKLTVFR
jgi:glycine dehydrogenase subunit 2